MSLAAGVNFGTLSVGVSIFDHQQGRLGSATADYPLLRKKEDPDHATQSHRDHMNALVSATRKAISAAGVRGKDFWPSRSILPGRASSRWMRNWSRWTITTSGA